MISPISVILEVCLQKIWKEEEFQDNEHDEEFDQNDQPNLFPPPGKVRKSIIIKPESTFK
jgi:hypothetical protein